MRFLGNIEAKTDVKGRVFLPSVFRKVLQASGEEQLVLRKDIYQKCLRHNSNRGNRRINRCSASSSRKRKPFHLTATGVSLYPNDYKK